jgi:membrane protein required for colicin V production
MPERADRRSAARSSDVRAAEVALTPRAPLGIMPPSSFRTGRARVSPVDIVFTLLLVFALLRGYTKGLLGTAATYAAPVLAFMVAADWSGPVREWLAATKTIPEFFLEFLAPVVVFVAVVIVVRLTVAVLAGVLGIDRTLPSRILGAALGLAVSAVVLGAVVLLVRELRPKDRVRIEGDAGEMLVDPLEKAVVDIDRRFDQSLLGPPLAHYASTLVARLMDRRPGDPLLPDDGNGPVVDRDRIQNATKKAAEAAAEAIVNPKGGAPRDDRDAAEPAPRNR